jgi:hypothetical protein
LPPELVTQTHTIWALEQSWPQARVHTVRRAQDAVGNPTVNHAVFPVRLCSLRWKSPAGESNLRSQRSRASANRIRGRDLGSFRCYPWWSSR